MKKVILCALAVLPILSYAATDLTPQLDGIQKMVTQNNPDNNYVAYEGKATLIDGKAPSTEERNQCYLELTVSNKYNPESSAFFNIFINQKHTEVSEGTFCQNESGLTNSREYIVRKCAFTSSTQLDYDLELHESNKTRLYLGVIPARTTKITTVNIRGLSADKIDHVEIKNENLENNTTKIYTCDNLQKVSKK